MAESSSEGDVTTGILLLSGFVLWTLMVRRTLYREIRATRWADPGEIRRRTG